MTTIINLRQARKQRGRMAKRAKADANAAKFGEAKNQRQAREAEAMRNDRAHDAHKRDDG